MKNFNEIPVFMQSKDSKSEGISISLTEDYLGNRLEADIHIRLSLDSEYLIFTSRSKLFGETQSMEASFKEGLWNEQVSELFIFSQENLRYQEFNVSPLGGYWGMNFSKYRERTVPIDGLEYFIKNDSFALKIPLALMGLNLYASSTLFHIAGILRDKDNRAIYYSTNPIPNREPDFHSLESGLPIKIL